MGVVRAGFIPALLVGVWLGSVAPLFGGDRRPRSLVVAGVHQVGPTHAHKTIQSAVDAAVDGDLILVDPGSYGGFTVTAKGISVACADPARPFILTPDPRRSVVHVMRIARSQSVTIMGWRTDVQYGVAPVVRVSDCQGSVRILDAVLQPVGHLVSTPMSAVIRIDASASVALCDVAVWSAVRYHGATAQPAQSQPSITDHGLCAMLAVDSAVHLQRCALRGYDNLGTNQRGRWGGDGLRLLGRSSARIDDRPTRIEGGGGGEFGGSAVHCVGFTSQPDVLACGVSPAAFAAGEGPQRGGIFACNHDRGLFGGGTYVVPSCFYSDFGAVQAPKRLHIGQPAQVAVWSYFSRTFLLAASTPRLGRLPGCETALHLDLASPFALLLGGGVLVADLDTNVPVRVPAQANLVGFQLTLQAVLGPVPGWSSVPALSLPQASVITP